MLIFYLIGINTKDLFSLTSKNAVNGRIEYRRAKTGRWYSIKLEPEAMVLIERYKGKNYLLSVLDEYGNYKDFQHRMNDNLSEIGPTVRKGLGGKKYREPLFPELTTYWARHSWIETDYHIVCPYVYLSACTLGNNGISFMLCHTAVMEKHVYRIL